MTIADLQERITELITQRYADGWNDREMAEDFNIPQQKVNDIRHGKRDAGNLRLSTVARMFPLADVCLDGRRPAPPAYPPDILQAAWMLDRLEDAERKRLLDEIAAAYGRHAASMGDAG